MLKKGGEKKKKEAMSPKRKAFKNHPRNLRTQITNHVSCQYAWSTDASTPVGCRIQNGDTDYLVARSFTSFISSFIGSSFGSSSSVSIGKGSSVGSLIGSLIFSSIFSK